MKSSAIIILAFLVLFQAFSHYIVMAGFFAARDRIAATLCVNKAKPMMQCKGKCFLKKKLAEQADNESTASGFKQKMVESIVSLPSFLDTPFQLRICSSFGLSAANSHLSSFHQDIFRPPISAA